MYPVLLIFCINIDVAFNVHMVPYCSADVHMAPYCSARIIINFIIVLVSLMMKREHSDGLNPGTGV